jgi:hypothetical protein
MLPCIPRNSKRVSHFTVGGIVPTIYVHYLRDLGTLNYTKTALGRSLLHSWLMRPSSSISVIKSRHEAVACFSKPENLAPTGVMHGHLKGVKNVPRILAVMGSGKIKVADWQALTKVWMSINPSNNDHSTLYSQVILSYRYAMRHDNGTSWWRYYQRLATSMSISS